MHKISLNQTVVDGVIRRRGRRHSFSDLDPKRTALLVVDMQNAYCEPGFSPSYNQNVLDIVPNINRIAVALRRAGGLPVWINNVATREAFTDWSVLNQRMLPAKSRDDRLEWYGADKHGSGFWRGLDIQPGDLKVTKQRFSAFIRGSSNIEPQLRQRNIDTVIVTGTGTGTCCESTARDAMMLNFATMMISDANACNSDEEHNAALTGFYRNFGDVMSTDEVVSFIETNAAAARKTA